MNTTTRSWTRIDGVIVAAPDLKRFDAPLVVDAFNIHVVGAVGFGAMNPTAVGLDTCTDWTLPNALALLSASQRADVKHQFADSGVVFWGCGSVCEFHSDNPTVVKKNIEDCKAFVKLVHDIGGTGVKVRPNGVPKGADEQKFRP